MWLSTISILFMIVTKTLPTLAYPPQVVSADRLPTLLHGHIDIGDTVHLRPESERTDAEFVNHMRPVGRVRLEDE